MRRGALFSALVHVAVLLVAVFGIPSVLEDRIGPTPPIPVEMVTIDDETRAPVPMAEPEPEPQPEPQPEPEPAPAPAPAPEPAPPAASPAAPPSPAPSPAPREVVPAAPPPVPPPVPKPEARPKPPPERPSPAPQTAAAPRKKPAPERQKPAADEFMSVLRTVEELKSQAPHQEKQQESADRAPEPPQSQPSVSPARRLTMSELDAVRAQIARCWNIPAGARDAENLVVEIWVAMLPDGRVSDARIVDRDRAGRDPFFRAAAESALRAVLNPQCSPLRLPPEKYEVWRTMTLAFNPKEMFGS